MQCAGADGCPVLCLHSIIRHHDTHSEQSVETNAEISAVRTYVRDNIYPR